MPVARTTVLIMAAGTGGHVFPALAIARHLQARGANIEWLGTYRGMENDLLAGSGFTMHHISVSGLKGSGLKRKLMAPFMLVAALWQSLAVIRQVQPHCVLGMGGFVCGPGGLAAKLHGTPLLIHEQNAVAGFTNRVLSRIATRVFEAFPNTFPASAKVLYTGNPLRADIVALHAQDVRPLEQNRPIRLLVLGGSQGATAINKVIPQLLAQWPQSPKPEVWHQAGKRGLDAAIDDYKQFDLVVGDDAAHSSCRVVPFIEDMAAAYRWADLVICRSGASTVSELAAAGLPAILIPYPHHSDQQQLHNANWLVNGGAACLLEQSDLSVSRLLELLLELDGDKQQLQRMAQAAQSLAICDAGEVIAQKCLEYAHG